MFQIKLSKWLSFSQGWKLIMKIQIWVSCASSGSADPQWFINPSQPLTQEISHILLPSWEPSLEAPANLIQASITFGEHI